MADAASRLLGLNSFFATTLTGIFLSRFAMLGAAALLLTSAIHQANGQRDLAVLENEERLELKAQRLDLTREIETMAGDLLSARYTLDLIPALGSVRAAHAQAIEQFSQMLRYKPAYFQARLLNAAGQEVVRVGTSGGSNAPSARPLGNMRGRSYFSGALQLADGDIYVSTLDLASAQGKVVEPYRPVVRMATPLYQGSLRPLGVLMLDVDADRLIGRFREGTSDLRGTAYLVNRDGYYLHSPQPEDRWGYLLPQRADRRFATRFPDAWTTIRSAESGQFDSRDGLITFETVVPALAARQLLTHKIANYAEASAAPGEWKLVSVVSPETLAGMGGRTRGGAWQLDAAGLAIAAMLAGLLAWQRMTRIRGFRAVRDREARLRLVMDNVPAMIAYLDNSEHYLFANRSFLLAFGLDEEKLKGRTVREVVGEQTYALVEPPLREALAGKTVRYERKLQAGEGAMDLDVVYAPHKDRLGVVRGVFAMLVDLSERKRLEQIRSHFVSMVSHEMRSPLTSILGALDEALEALPAQPAAARSMLEMARRSAERLVTVANDVLDLERLDSEIMKIVPRAVDLSELLLEAVQANRAGADKVGVGLRAMAREPAGVMADPDRLMQVLTNLISNAVKASPPGEWVTVSLERRAMGVRVSVVDRGPGIAPAFQPRIFERFAQARPGGEAKSGSGLGLAICKEIIQRSGGQIGFATAQGAGTTFWFELPLEPAVLPDRVI